MDAFAVFLFHAHSGLRYLVLLVGVASFLYSLLAAVTRRPWDRGGRVLLITFVAFVDIQVLLGLVLVFFWPFYPAMWGHITTMVAAAAVAHFTNIYNRRRPPESISHMPVALGVAAALILIVAGTAAIGRPIL